MLNIDFTGGTLVTIQLNPKTRIAQGHGRRPSGPRWCGSGPRRSCPIRRWSRSPSARNPSGYRFNLRTTEETQAVEAGSTKVARNLVQDKVRKKFDPILARLELTVGKPEADRCLPARPSRRR